MRKRRTAGCLLAVAATITMLGAASASAASASATPAAPRHGLSHVTVINLHARYEKALPHARVGRISGIDYARGKQAKAAGAQPGAGRSLTATTGATAATATGVTATTRAAAATACTEPDCPVPYNGGAVQHDPRVYLLLWGPNWATNSSEEASAAYLQRFYSGLGVQPQDTWSRITEIYGDSSGNPVFSGSVFAGTWLDSGTPPTGVNPVEQVAEAESFAVLEGIPDLADAQIVIATQSGTCPLLFSCGGDGTYCAWHSETVGLIEVPFINLPYQPDAGSGCAGTLDLGPYDGFSITGGHEYAETITDPLNWSAWWDPNDNSDGGALGGGEIADKCENSADAPVSLSTGTFAMQPLFSNAAYAATGQGCTFGWPDNVAVSSPGSPSDTVHTSVSLQVRASSSAGYPLSYSAANLPIGLSISSSGLISGTPTTSGSYPVAVTVSDESGASSSVDFTWTINGSGDAVTVTSPGTLSSHPSVKVSVQIKASSSGGFPLTYSATGLPPGLSIGSTGLISGTPTTNGQYTVRVIATDSAGAAGEATFTWTVLPVITCTPCGCTQPQASPQASPQICKTAIVSGQPAGDAPTLPPLLTRAD